MRRFAAPFVVVAVSPGCNKPVDDAARPRPGDAGAVAPTGTLRFFDSASGGCMTYPDRRAFECDGNVTVIFPWKTFAKPDGSYSYDTRSTSCNVQRPASCPPNTPCNPPAPEPVTCPPELMPTLTGGATMTRRDGDACYWNDLQVLCPGPIVFDDPTCYHADATGQRTWIECPPEMLPPTPTDDLIYARGTMCFPVRSTGGQGRVTCPPGGATVVMPTETSKDLGGKKHVGFNAWEMVCKEWTEMHCPQGASCNPPPPQTVECPPEMLPTLANGVVPTETKDGKCYWGTYRVACP